MSRLDFPTFYVRLRERIAAREPFSLVRAGDGEGMILGYPGLTPLAKLNKRLDKWFGASSMSGHEKIAFCENMRQAFNNATMIGIPGLRHHKVNQDWRNVEKYLSQLGYLGDDRDVFCMDCTVDLHRKGLYPELLETVDTLYCISCRDLTGELKKAFGLKEVRTFRVPPQNLPYRKQKGVAPPMDAHFPVLYNRIMAWIDDNVPAGRTREDPRAHLFFVGAGGLGKVYCERIRQCGGMAVDVGSMFDGWAGLVTRSYLANIREYRL